MSNQSSQVANYLLDKADNEGESLTSLKLLKILYICHGWCLATLGHDILDGEKVEAWQHGPVIPSVYHEFKRYGPNPITEKAAELTFSGLCDNFSNVSVEKIYPELKDPKVREVIDYVWSTYKQYTGFDLVDMTHEQGTPWSNYFVSGQRYTEIPNEAIYEYYKKQLSQLIGSAEAV